MEEEFQEADVMWPDDVALGAHHHDCHRRQHLALAGHQNQKQQPRPRAAASAVAVHPLQSSSPPVRIPSMPCPTSRYDPWWTRSCDDDDDDGGAEEAGIVPPHVVAARRCAEERRDRVAASVCVGHGRTLKGRDLRAVRNAVLHMTGFLSSSDKY